MVIHSPKGPCVNACVCVNGITVNVRVCTLCVIAAARGHKKVVRSEPFEVISLCLTNVVKLSTP